MAKNKLALALGGGAARGWAHIGILRELERAGLRPDIVVGTSIGAIVGGHYAAARLDALEEFARSLSRRMVFGYLDLSVSGSGLIRGQRLFDRFDAHLAGLAIEELPVRFVAIATELTSGHEVWLRRGRITDAVRASSAIPGIVTPVRLNGRWLVDGSMVNPIPVSVCRALGASKVIAVNLNADSLSKGGLLMHDEPDLDDLPAPNDEQLPSGWNGRAALTLLHRQMFGRSHVAAPGISTVILNSFSIVHDRIARARLMGDPPDLLISPDLSGIGLFDFHRAEEMILRGEEEVKSNLRAIERLVNFEPLPRRLLGRTA